MDYLDDIMETSDFLAKPEKEEREWLTQQISTMMQGVAMYLTGKGLTSGEALKEAQAFADNLTRNITKTS